MGKRPRTPHFITGIGDGNVHESSNHKTHNNNNISRLRGNNNKNNNNNQNNNNNNNKNKNNYLTIGRSKDDDKDNNILSSGHSNDHNRLRSAFDLRHHREQHQQQQQQQHDRDEILKRIEEPLLAKESGDGSGDAWGDAFPDPVTGVPVDAADGNANANANANSKLGMGPPEVPATNDINTINSNDININNSNSNSNSNTAGPWQISTLVFYVLGIVVVVGIVLHFVSELAIGSAGDCGAKAGERSSSGNGSGGRRSHFYRRRQRQRQRQRRMMQQQQQQKRNLRKKKTDEWSDDEEPLQDGAGLFSMSNSMLPSFARTVGEAVGYGSRDRPPYPHHQNHHHHSSYSPYSTYPDSFDYDYDYDYDLEQDREPDNEYERDYENDYDYDSNGNNNVVYNPTDYYREPDSHLAAQGISHRRTGANYSQASSSSTMMTNRSGAVGVGVGVVPTYKFPTTASHYGTQPQNSQGGQAKPKTMATPQRGISPMNSYSSAGSGSKQRPPKQSVSPKGGAGSPTALWGGNANANISGNKSSASGSSNGRKNKGAFAGGGTPTGTGTMQSSYSSSSAEKRRTPSTPDRFLSATGSWHQRRKEGETPNKDSKINNNNASFGAIHQSALLIPTKDTVADGVAAASMGAAKRTTELGARLLEDTGSRFSSFASIMDAEEPGAGTEEPPERGCGNGNGNGNSNNNNNNHRRTLHDRNLHAAADRRELGSSNHRIHHHHQQQQRQHNHRTNRDGYDAFETFDVSSSQLELELQSRSHHSRNSNNPNNDSSPALSAAYHDSFASSVRQQTMHQKSLLLTPGNCEETPLIGNSRKTISIHEVAASNAAANANANAGDGGGGGENLDAAALLPIAGTPSKTDEGAATTIPYIPILNKTDLDLDFDFDAADKRLSPPRRTASPPPRSIIMDELRLVEMETGNSTHWDVENSESSHLGDYASFAGDFGVDVLPDEVERDGPRFAAPAGVSRDKQSFSDDNSSDISIPSGDPRKSIIHKRQNLTMATDSATSLQSSINFSELQLEEVIGGGGFGQVWKANWRGTPVAVKVLTGSAQNTHIAKAILEEFNAEINLLKGMRHPNICLYMGACMTPPNRAIITELAANGSVWDSLRLPLAPPYKAADGSPNGSWPINLYLPSHHGVPPRSGGSSRSMEISAPIPPRGTWPWELVKRVSCGAARGMAYLHSGHPPVLHRDLKSANLLLDESYTTKVCDFGLSRLKAQARSMTANCGTVQWMAPEVLANRSYDEKADVYSFGIIVWELLSRECPYEGMTAIQCALAVLNRDKRPEIPKWCPPGLHALIKSCTKKNPSERPSFAEIIVAIDSMG